MKRVGLLIAVFSFLFLPAAHGQLGIYGGFSASQSVLENSGWLYGATFGAYYTAVHMPVINFGADVRGSVLNANQEKIYSGMIGPRAILHLPVLPIKPYAEALVGAGHFESGQGSGSISGTSFSYGFAAGADLTFFPRLDWRVIEYSYARLPDILSGINQNTLTTGIVFRVPFL